MPRNSGGCVYCGASRSPSRPKLSLAVAEGPPPSTPGSSRTIESTIAAAARAGVTGAAIDGAARKVIQDAGYGSYFGHSFGHSLGIDIHEAPNAAPGNDKPMPDGAVISAEPGIYLPGKFGVRIEDVMILRADGAQVITKAPKALLVL